jgi:cellulose synthase/poly-beta-1,6-N-acetylglucosamine synthase-like glycosyltransferase
VEAQARPADIETPTERVARTTLALYREKPHYSARKTFSLSQLALFYGVVTAACAGLAFAPMLCASVFVGFFILFYLASFLFKAALFAVGPAPSRIEAPRQTDAALPVYTILVPLYRESRALPALLRALAALDYPTGKLDIKLLLEADDKETAGAISRFALPPHLEIVSVPIFRPRTKPKALCYGLSYARGDFLVVYDAEDQPEPDQLRQALSRFAALGPDTACLQARLNVFNARENWLCRLYAIDYCLWFDHFLPGLEAIKAPLPLGGTSNHFRTHALLAAGGWDPFNVTEDADLGIRFAREGWHVGTLASTTFEEAPPRLAPWLAQRARWMKGYMQTYLVHMRDQKRLARETGIQGRAVLELFLLGSAVAGLANPVLWLLFAAWLLLGRGVLGGLTGEALLAVSLIGLVGGNGLILFLSLLAPLRRGWLDLVPYALTTPLYWLLVSLAAWHGLFSLLFRPFHWAKTAHGLTRFEARAGLSERRAP